jgi:hypothetical protein
MSERRGLVFLGLLVLLAWGIAISKPIPILVPVPAVAQQPSGKAANSAANTAQQISIQDAAAETIAKYTEALAWFTGVLVVVSIYQGAMLYRADKTARISADAAKQAAEAAVVRLRPWIKIIGTAPQNIAVEEDGRLTLSLSVKIMNVGKTPATGVITAVEYRAVYAELGMPLPVKEAKVALREGIERRRNTRGAPCYVIFPNDDPTREYKATIPIEGNPTGRAYVIFAFGASYKFGGGSGRTEMAGAISGDEPGKMGIPTDSNSCLARRFLSLSYYSTEDVAE